MDGFRHQHLDDREGVTLFRARLPGGLAIAVTARDRRDLGRQLRASGLLDDPAPPIALPSYEDD